MSRFSSWSVRGEKPPLNNELILASIFAKLRFNELLIARRVSQIWCKEASKAIAKISVIILQNEEEMYKPYGEPDTLSNLESGNSELLMADMNIPQIRVIKTSYEDFFYYKELCLSCFATQISFENFYLNQKSNASPSNFLRFLEINRNYVKRITVEGIHPATWDSILPKFLQCFPFLITLHIVVSTCCHSEALNLSGMQSVCHQSETAVRIRATLEILSSVKESVCEPDAYQKLRCSSLDPDLIPKSKLQRFIWTGWGFLRSWAPFLNVHSLKEVNLGTFSLKHLASMAKLMNLPGIQTLDKLKLRYTFPLWSKECLQELLDIYYWTPYSGTLDHTVQDIAALINSLPILRSLSIQLNVPNYFTMRLLRKIMRCPFQLEVLITAAWRPAPGLLESTVLESMPEGIFEEISPATILQHFTTVRFAGLRILKLCIETLCDPEIRQSRIDLHPRRYQPSYFRDHESNFCKVLTRPPPASWLREEVFYQVPGHQYPEQPTNLNVMKLQISHSWLGHEDSTNLDILEQFYFQLTVTFPNVRTFITDVSPGRWWQIVTHATPRFISLQTLFLHMRDEFYVARTWSRDEKKSGISLKELFGHQCRPNSNKTQDGSENMTVFNSPARSKCHTNSGGGLCTLLSMKNLEKLRIVYVPVKYGVQNVPSGIQHCCGNPDLLGLKVLHGLYFSKKLAYTAISRNLVPNLETPMNISCKCDECIYGYRIHNFNPKEVRRYSETFKHSFNDSFDTKFQYLNVSLLDIPCVKYISCCIDCNNRTQDALTEIAHEFCLL